MKNDIKAIFRTLLLRHGKTKGDEILYETSTMYCGILHKILA